ncbi:MAG: DUF2892 domain-containing protein [Gammaproteobacteria bacterium]|nr:DUF2892 domain-containing protein [Gammaproteobacteria bacterium]
MKLSLNVGSTDRWIRVAVGCLLVWAPFAGLLTGSVGMVAYIVGAVAIVTGLFRFCPAYTVLGISTGKSGE